MSRGKRYTTASGTVDREKIYALDEAVKIVKANAKAKFDETVELCTKLNVDPRHADQVVRGTLGRLLFSGDEVKKNVKVLSGGEKGRMLFGKLMLAKPNVLLMDEPTNHMDMESIESLNTALDLFKGTLIFVSHDREFVSSLATRIIEISDKGVNDYHGTYEEFLRDQMVE